MTAPNGAPAGAGALPSLRRNFAVTLSGNVLYAACQWAILVVLAKLLPAESVGLFVLGISVATPVFFLANLQLGNVQATDAKRETPFVDYLRLRLLTTLGAAVLLATIVLVFRYSQTTAAVILVVGAAKAFDALSDIFHGLYQQQERMHLISASLAINAVASLAATALAVVWKRDVLWAAAAFALGSLVALGLYNLPVGSAAWRRSAGGTASLFAAAFATRWPLAGLARLAWLALPLGFSSALVTFNGNLPRYFIDAELGKAPLAVFAAMAYVMTAGVTFVGALCNAAVPRMARHWAARDLRRFDRLVIKVMGVAAAAGLAGVAVALAAGRLILTLLYRPEYAEHHAVFAWVMGAAAVTYVSSVLAYAVAATRAFGLLTVPYGAVTLATLLACWLLVPRFGLTGAAWALGVSGIAGCASAGSILYRLRRKVRTDLTGSA